MDPRQLLHVQASYDQLAAPYAERLSEELKGKPLDRQLLDRFADRVRGEGPACDIGCGPGHIARYLHDRGVEICGMDLSAEMVAQARQRHPGIEFRQGDLFAMDAPNRAWAGIVAFYSLVHIPPADLSQALRALRRVLRPGGLLLLAFHVGHEVVHPDELWGVPVDLDWHFVPTGEMVCHLEAGGFTIGEVIERGPYEGVEHPSRRAYLFATSPASSNERPPASKP